FEVIQGLLDAVMVSLNVPHSKEGKGYWLSESDLPTYLPGRCADVMYRSEEGKVVRLGAIGVLHPEVLVNFELDYPVSTFEINVEEFL
ncbi:phenylalanine--tRNA ligase subunit beta, partial [Linderina pennispora]